MTTPSMECIAARYSAGLHRLAQSSVLVAVLLLAGCGDRASQASPELDGSGRNRGGTLVVALGADIGGVNELTAYSTAHTTGVLYRLFLPLLEERPDFADHPPTFAPRLARSFEWSDDHRILTFHLRDDVYWSDGVPVTAEDVRFTWEAHVHPDVAWETAYMKEAITEVEVVDTYTVRFYFDRVYPAQLVHANEGLILPKHVWSKMPFDRWRESGSWFRDNLVTNGPFELRAWRPQEEIVLTRYEDYYEEGLPLLDRVVLRIIPSQHSQIAQLLAETVDFVIAISPEDAERVKKNPNLRLINFWSRGTIFVAWNNEHPLFRDVRVRQALTLAIDRQAIIDNIWGEYARVATSPTLSFVWAFNRSLEPWPYAPSRARELLAAAGFEDRDGDGVVERGGLPFRFELLTHSGNRERQDAAVMIQQQLRLVGIDAQPRLLDFNAFVAQVSDREYESFIGGIATGTDLDLRPYFHSDQIGLGVNYARYANPVVDRLIDAANHQTDLADMKPYLDRVQTIIHRDQPLTFLWESQRLDAAHKRVHDATPNALFDLYNLREWWVEPRR